MLLTDRVSRGGRVQEIQRMLGYDKDNIGFASRLNEAATSLGLPEVWHSTRLSKVRNGTQDLSLEDATVIAFLDPERRGWTWISFGIATRKGEDAWAVLKRTARKTKIDAG